MILVAGARVETLSQLLDHPALLASTSDFKALPLLELTGSNSSSSVCVLQKEFATASPELVEFVGTDDATTCVGLGIRDPKSGLTSVAHLDFAGCVKQGLSQMLSSVSILPDSDTVLELHIVGAYDDSPDMVSCSMDSESGHSHSWPLCLELVDALRASPYRVEVRTLCILGHNTVRGGDTGYACPAVRGLAIQTRSGRCFPALFSDDARGPDGIVRALSLYATEPAFRLRSPYDTKTDTFTIAPFQWSRGLRRFAAQSLALSDAELLQTRSTSPYAEGPDFVATIRRLDAYIYKHPDWEYTFPNRQSRKFVRDPGTGRWTRVGEHDGEDHAKINRRQSFSRILL